MKYEYDCNFIVYRVRRVHFHVHFILSLKLHRIMGLGSIKGDNSHVGLECITHEFLPVFATLPNILSMMLYFGKSYFGHTMHQKVYILRRAYRLW